MTDDDHGAEVRPASVFTADALTAPDLSRLAAEAVLVVPVGSTEQHGPCLPLSTDALLVTRVVDIASRRLRSHRPVIVAPTLSYGQSQHHLFAGALSLRPRTLLAVLDDLIDSASASGFRRLLLVNGHGGNDECVRIAVKDGANRHPMVLAGCNYWDFAAQAWQDRYPHIPGHAGAFECSLVLAAAPHLVRSGELSTAIPGPAGVHECSISPAVTVARAGDWAGSGGYTDPPAAAHAEDGEGFLEALGTALAVAIDRLAELPLRYGEDAV